MSAFLRKYATGTGADVYIPVIKRGVIDFAVGADWTPAAGDVKVSIDGGAVANIGTLPVAIASGNTAIWHFVLSNAELTGKSIAVFIADAATKAVEDQAFIIETYGNASAMHPFDLATATQAVSVASGGITSASFASAALTAAAIATDAIGAAAIATDAIGSAELATSAVTEIVSAVTVALAPATGLAQAGATASITIAAGDAGATSAYVGRLCIITAGTGRGQARAVTANDGTTKVVTVAGNWSIVPDSTSRYALVVV